MQQQQLLQFVKLILVEFIQQQLGVVLLVLLKLLVLVKPVEFVKQLER